MENTRTLGRIKIMIQIVLWGCAWGIFESTLGYALHAVSFGYGWTVWYPVACFFMANVYRRTRNVSAVFYTGIFCASVKLLNLFLPGSIDRVINPAVSIVFEAMCIAAVILVFKRLSDRTRKSPLSKALAVLCMNTGWRLLYMLYLLLLVPDWMREVSVIVSTDKFIVFFITQNVLTSLIVFIGFLFSDYIFKPLKSLESGISRLSSPRGTTGAVWIFTAVLLAADIALELLL